MSVLLRTVPIRGVYEDGGSMEGRYGGARQGGFTGEVP